MEQNRGPRYESTVMPTLFLTKAPKNTMEKKAVSTTNAAGKSGHLLAVN
jgi:hypothetical protein